MHLCCDGENVRGSDRLSQPLLLRLYRKEVGPTAKAIEPLPLLQLYPDADDGCGRKDDVRFGCTSILFGDLNAVDRDNDADGGGLADGDEEASAIPPRLLTTKKYRRERSIMVYVCRWIFLFLFSSVEENGW